MTLGGELVMLPAWETRSWPERLRLIAIYSKRTNEGGLDCLPHEASEA